MYGGKLAQSGARVSVVCRSDYEEILKNGIRINSLYGDFQFNPHSVIKNGSDYSCKPDYVIIAVKALPEIDIIAMIKDSVYPDTAIVIIQNGIRNEEQIAEYFKKNEIISGLAFVCATRVAYGIIDHSDYGRIVLGNYPEGISEKTKTLVRMFMDSGIPAEAERDIIGARWKKLLWNAPFNPLSVICGGAYTSELINNKNIRDLTESIMYEIMAIADADGHPLPEELINKNIEDTKKMKPYKTSMLLDYESKRPMEIEAILGNVIKIADDKRIGIPNIKSLYAILGILNKKNLKA